MDYTKLREDVHVAISGAFTEQDEMLNKWTLMAETIDAEGRRSLSKVNSDGTTSWDSIGMLQAGQALYQAQAYNEFEEDD